MPDSGTSGTTTTRNKTTTTITRRTEKMGRRDTRGAASSKEETVRRLGDAGVIAIFRVDDPRRCLDAMDALLEGGVTAFEVTTTTPGVMELVAQARDRYGARALVGIGTVLDRATARAGIRAGAQFVISPSFQRDVVDECKRSGVVSCPGTFTATEMVQAWRAGADLIKVFPISQVGPGYIRAVLAPLPQLRLVPTGGVDAANAREYIKAGAYCLGVGGSLLSKEAVKEGRFAEITAEARKLSDAVREARGGA